MHYETREISWSTPLFVMPRRAFFFRGSQSFSYVTVPHRAVNSSLLRSA